MKKSIPIIRWIVGLLFVFSGLIKANDPYGLSYKMQEFFEVWGWDYFKDASLGFAILMNLFEVVAGIAVLIGWQMRIFSWLLLMLITGFSFLTGYALLSGQIKTCGCLGDCLPLTAAQSFAKDIVLLVLIILLTAYRNKIQVNIASRSAIFMLMLGTLGTIGLEAFVLKYLPIIDCLPYKSGNNIIKAMQVPAGAIPDSLSLEFVYEKNGKRMRFDQAHFPADFDSTYQFIERKDVVVKKGNGLVATIPDFTLRTQESDQDTTQALFSNTEKYLLLMVKDFDAVSDWKPQVDPVIYSAGQKGIPVLIVTADATMAAVVFKDQRILKCDATVIKTAARVTPSFLCMEHADIKAKYSYASTDRILNFLNKW